MKKLVHNLKEAGKTTRLFRGCDGTRLLVLPHGGRVLGFYPPQSDENFYWTNPALQSATESRELYSGNHWHNSGGDRTWLAPEVDLFFPNFPKLDKYCQQPALDPGQYQLVTEGNGFKLVNRLTVHLSRPKQNVSLQITKSFGSAAHPLRYERGLDLESVECAGYTQHTSLELLDGSNTAKMLVGLWNLVQMPHGGEMIIPTYSKTRPFQVFGEIPRVDLSVTDRVIRYRMRQRGEQKISLRAVAVCGRVGYVYPTGDRWALVIRCFTVNPSGEYVDVPWSDPDFRGFAVQACNVNNGLGRFSELEYHVPAIGGGAGHTYCEDTAQIWAFRGPQRQIAKIRKLLVG